MVLEVTPTVPDDESSGAKETFLVDISVHNTLCHVHDLVVLLVRHRHSDGPAHVVTPGLDIGLNSGQSYDLYRVEEIFELDAEEKIF